MRLAQLVLADCSEVCSADSCFGSVPDCYYCNNPDYCCCSAGVRFAADGCYCYFRIAADGYYSCYSVGYSDDYCFCWAAC